MDLLSEDPMDTEWGMGNEAKEAELTYNLLACNFCGLSHMRLLVGVEILQHGTLEELMNPMAWPVADKRGHLETDLSPP